MADVRTGDGELPEQVPHHSRMGRPVYQMQGAPQLSGCYEALSLLQGDCLREYCIAVELLYCMLMHYS